MTAFHDLEIGLRRGDADSYSIELRLNQPPSDTEVRLMRDESPQVRFDRDGLGELALDSAAYGELLTKSLFADSRVWTAFAQARSTAQAADASLRLRLFIGQSAPELHGLRWETLRDPEDGSSFVTSEHILFSRYLNSWDWRPVRLRALGDLHALVAVANPADLVSWSLVPVDVPGEIARAKSALGSIPVTTLASAGSTTLDKLVAQLREVYDILYLVCHGTLIRDEPRVLLENEAGNTASVAGSELVTRLSELQQRPALVVLASCQSAGSGGEYSSGDKGALSALGPRLAEAGIPAVVAMQSNVTIQTVEGFMPVFFRELCHDGQIDRAMAAARGAVRDRPDWWMPVLFMRLKSGRIWYTPGFAADSQGFQRRPALLSSIRSGECTPILGPGLIEPLFGSSRALAQRLADANNFPLAPYSREDLPQVTQYLAITQDLSFARKEFQKYLRREVLKREGSDLPDELKEAPLDQLLAEVGKRRRERDPGEPHAVLAGFEFPIYITANEDNLLAQALVAKGKRPEVVLCPWNDHTEQTPSVYDDEPNYKPSAQRPLVYHLFGQFREPKSLVLTEDDYFKYLMGVTANKELIPEKVRRALADSALLFLGFQLDDWNFRVLFRSLMEQEGKKRLDDYTHVGVQIEPEEGRTLDPRGARRYLEFYFRGAKIDIYWGSTEDFIKELQPRPGDSVPAGQGGGL
ncbi:MAG: CHAT domain-containing protein [Gammaproteobacteria bacterium]